MRRRRYRVIKGGRTDPYRFWPESKRKSNGARYLPLWLGAVGAGLAYAYFTTPVASSGPDKPILWNETQEVPKAVADPADAQWAQRARSFEETSPARLTEQRTSFGFCHTGGGTNCVVDGDTIWLQGENIRIADIDAPETHEYRCASEKELGDRATQRLLQLVSHGSITLRSIDRDTDVYGRKLRLVFVDGKDVGETLVEEGLARYYAGGKRSWC